MADTTAAHKEDVLLAKRGSRTAAGANVAHSTMAFAGNAALSIHTVMPPPDVKGVMPPTMTLDGNKLEAAFMALHSRIMTLEGAQAAQASAARAAAERAAADAEADDAEDARSIATLASVSPRPGTAPADGSSSSSEDALRQEIALLRARIDSANNKGVRREKAQIERDTAQDAMRQMEFARMNMQLNSKVSPSELEQVSRQAANRAAYLEEQLQELITVRIRQVQAMAEEQIGSVLSLVSAMQTQVDSVQAAVAAADRAHDTALEQLRTALNDSATATAAALAQAAESTSAAVQAATAAATAAAASGAADAVTTGEKFEQHFVEVAQKKLSSLLPDPITGKWYCTIVPYRQQLMYAMVLNCTYTSVMSS
eukprot:13077-Heterococcus_DN1.PRE.4